MRKRGEFGDVGRREAIDEEGMRLAGRKAYAGFDGFDRKPIVEPDGDASLRTQHFEPHVVSVRVVAARRHMRERAVGQFEKPGDRIDVADLTKELLASDGAACVHLDDLLTGDPTDRI